MGGKAGRARVSGALCSALTPISSLLSPSVIVEGFLCDCVFSFDTWRIFCEIQNTQYSDVL